jgi:drug/metabolite transporter (DMT)-like permease
MNKQPSQTATADATARKTINQTMAAREWLLIVVLSIIWGGSFFFVGVAVKEMPPLTIVWCRVGLAALILLGFVVLTGRKMPSSLSFWSAIFIMGVLNNLIPFSLIVWGQTHIESSLASILNATMPIFSVILAHIMTKDERLTVNRTAGILLGWIGVTVLIGIESLQGFGVHILGQLAILGAAISYSFAAIFGRRFQQFDPIVVAAGMVCASAIMMTPLAIIIDHPWTLAPGPAAWAALLGLAALSTSLAYILYFRILATAGATNISLVTLLIPVSAIFLGVVALGERPGWNAFAGMALIFLGLAAIDGRILTLYKRAGTKDQSASEMAANTTEAS